MLSQNLQQKLLQKLSPQQIQLMKLLQIPAMALEQRIKQEMEENPALEEEEEEYDDESFTDEEAPESNDENDEEEIFREEDDFDYEDYTSDDEIPDYRLKADNRSPDEEDRDIPFVSDTSFQEYLLTQIGMRFLSEKQKIIAEQIIGNFDDSGYLQREIRSMVDDFAFSLNLDVIEEEILEVLMVVQEFDPPGVGARNLQECLLLQLGRLDDNPEVANAELVLTKHFEEFSKKHYDKILRKTGISEEELKAAIEVILKLNPKPGNSMSETSKSNYHIIPDFLIMVRDGKISLELNARNLPELKVSRSYKEMLNTYSKGKTTGDKEAFMFVKQKVDSAKWFIDAIKQRHNTLRHTMEAILEYQKEYFLSGDETKIKPMILKDISDIVKLDISTISRVANSKYVQTPFGTFLLKTFFSESMSTDSGEEVSSREIKKILQDNIGREDKHSPLTDEELAVILNEKGYQIARRTVAKYREQLNIPVARLRKEL
jgi:RNA polymerase sigma-54 factor